MGTWSEEAFGNDSACDWAYALEDTSDLSLIERTLADFLGENAKPQGLFGRLWGRGNHKDADSAALALAAADVVARLLGNFGYRNAYTESVDKWVEKVRLSPTPDIVAKAQRAVDRVTAPRSELRELWEDANRFEDWQDEVNELRARLAA